MPTRYREGAKRVAALTPAAFSFGAAFGVLAGTAGFDSASAIAMSATTFAGAAQFAAVTVLEDGGTIAAAVAAAVLLNARYLAISISIAPDFEGSRLRRLLESQLIVDESWAVSQVGRGRIDRRMLIGAGLVLFPFWVGGTALGALAGDVIGDPGRLGFDGALPALFLALLVTQLVDRRAKIAALAGGAIALVLIPLTPRRACHRRKWRLPLGAQEAMSEAWAVVLLVGAFTIAFKAAGPVVLGGRPLPPRVAGAFELLGPSLLAALVVTQAVGSEDGIVLDTRLVGVAAGLVAILLRAPLIVVIVVAAAATALARLL